MQQSVVKLKKEQIVCDRLPLAVYRELAAHLQQIEGVITQLIPQQAKQFDYDLSQVSGLEISYPTNLNSQYLARMQEILDYYEQHHRHSWQRKVID